MGGFAVNGVTSLDAPPLFGFGVTAAFNGSRFLSKAVPGLYGI